MHTPEFAFEHVASNVRAAVKRLGITYPVVQDNRYKTWDNYANQYWPAEYLIDKTGHIRHTNFGEGEYDKTEALIRQLLGTNGAHAQAEPNTTPTGLLTPETYLGYSRIANYVGVRNLARTQRRLPAAADAPGEHARLRRRVACRPGADRRRDGTRACGCTSTRRTSTSCSAGAARSAS